MKKYWLIIRNTWDEYLVYRLNFILWRARVVIRFLITYFLWSTIYSGNGQFFGYTRQTMLTYVMLVYIVSNLVFATRTQDIGSEINEGRLTNYLLKPINFFKGIAARDVSDKLLNFGFTIAEFVILLLLLKPPFLVQSNGWFILAALTAFAGAAIVYFCVSILLGFVGFWTPETWGARFIFIILLDFLAGNFFPIDILPQSIARVLLLTPFPYMFYFPVKIYLGQLGVGQIAQGFVVMGIWCVCLILLVKYVWRAGLKVYSAEGR